jgi:integrase
MATLIKKTGSKYWHAIFRVPLPEGGSKLVSRSTRKTKKSQASIAAAKIQEATMAEAGAGDAKSRQILSVITRATEEAQKGVLNATRGRELIAEILKISTGEEMPSYSIRGWVDEWMKRQEGVSESTTRAYNTYTKQFLRGLGERAAGTLQSLTTEDIRNVRKWFKDGAGGKKSASVTTANLKMKVISSIFIEAMKEGITNFNPVAALKPLPADTSVTRKPFTAEEVAKLADNAPNEEWRGMILLGAYTGLRLVDCATLVWKDVDLKRREIVTVPEKTKRKKTTVTIPLHDTLFEFLKSRPIPMKPESPVFPSLTVMSGTGRNGLSKQFTQIMETARVGRGESSNNGGRTNYERSFHSLRHTLTSWLADSNVSPEIRMKIIGHKSREVHSLYTHLDNETLRAAMSAVPAI